MAHLHTAPQRKAYMQEQEKNIPFFGFNRVVINEHGEAVSLWRAKEMGINPVVGFMREDGWTLGAPEHLEDVAYSLWAGSWTHKISHGQPLWQELTVQ